MKTHFSKLLVLMLASSLAIAATFADQSEAAKKVFRETKARADKGDPHAQLEVAGMYDAGIGTSRDLGKASKYHRKAAEAGIAMAQYQLGLDYADGQGVKEDKTEAASWYFKAADQGLVEAQIAAGLCYLYGNGVAANGATALNWFQKAADKGSVQAEYELGKCYMDGTGIPKDVDDGVEHIKRAAEAGYPPAQNYLGSLYEKGLGVEKDYGQAYKWYSLAAAQDDAHAADINVSLAKAETFLTKEQLTAAQRSAHNFKPRPLAEQKPADKQPPAAATSIADAGFIQVNADDEQAEVFADGTFMGNSPAKLKLKDGPHIIEVKKAGCKPYRREVSVTSGSELNLRVSLEKE